VTFGPRNERDFSRKINRKAKAKALGVVLSKKLADGEMLFVDELVFDAPKASDAKRVLTSLGGIKGAEALATKRKNAAFIALSGRNENAEKSFRNYGNLFVGQVKDINPVDLLTYKYVVIANPNEAVKTLQERVSPTTKKSPVLAKQSGKGGKEERSAPKTVARKKPSVKKAAPKRRPVAKVKKEVKK